MSGAGSRRPRGAASWAAPSSLASLVLAALGVVVRWPCAACFVPSLPIGPLPRPSGVAVHLGADDETSAVGAASPLQPQPRRTTRIYLDVSVADEPVGRLVFHLPRPNPLPLHADNLVGLVRGSRRSIDPACTYVGCSFNYSPQYIDGMAQYRWGHVLPGRGRNAVGRADSQIEEKEAMRLCQRSAFGGSYYGIEYSDLPSASSGEDEGGVALTVPLSGPGRGSSCLSIVRVGESPREWGERLLMNSAVLGWMDPSCGGVLKAMARQRVGPPVVVASGVLEDDK